MLPPCNKRAKHFGQSINSNLWNIPNDCHYFEMIQPPFLLTPEHRHCSHQEGWKSLSLSSWENKLTPWKPNHCIEHTPMTSAQQGTGHTGEIVQNALDSFSPPIGFSTSILDVFGKFVLFSNNATPAQSEKKEKEHGCDYYWLFLQHHKECSTAQRSQHRRQVQCSPMSLQFDKWQMETTGGGGKCSVLRRDVSWGRIPS